MEVLVTLIFGILMGLISSVYFYNLGKTIGISESYYSFDEKSKELKSHKHAH
jgi:hypothetical protein